MKNFKILLVDDDGDSREVLEEFLAGILGYETVSCSNGAEAFEEFQNEDYSFVLTDIRMPRMNGLDLLKSIKQTVKGKICPVVLMTGFAELETAVVAIKYGAYDYIMKPVDINHLNDIITKIRTSDDTSEEDSSKEIKFTAKGTYLNIPKIGKVGIFSNKLSEAVKSANLYNQDRSINALIEGESGTGKEIIANIIHGLGNEKPFITVNCAAIAANLFESELFGYVGGAFSGAKQQGLAGKFELAQGGTLFLDEIGEMPLDMQPKLLRAIQEREIYRVGGQRSIAIDVRIIAATNRSLKQMIAEGKFREDLYHRINIGKIELLPLREQKESIIPLAMMMLEDAAKKRRKEFKVISNSAADILENYQWKGNIRELANAIDRAVLHFDGIELTARHLSFLSEEYSSSKGFELSPYADFCLPKDNLDLIALEKEIVRRALQKFDGNKTLTAQYLGLTRSALRSRME